MKTVHINAQTGHEFAPSLIPGGRLGLCNLISWRRLEQVLRDAGEIKKTEWLISYQIDESGIVYRVSGDMVESDKAKGTP